MFSNLWQVPYQSANIRPIILQLQVNIRNTPFRFHAPSYCTHPARGLSNCDDVELVLGPGEGC